MPALVDLTVAWGSQTRNYCPSCQRFVSSGAIVTCRGCGTVYLQDPQTGLYRVDVSEVQPS